MQQKYQKCRPFNAIASVGGPRGGPFLDSNLKTSAQQREPADTRRNHATLAPSQCPTPATIHAQSLERWAADAAFKSPRHMIETPQWFG
jgi:hypothetical protein